MPNAPAVQLDLTALPPSIEGWLAGVPKGAEVCVVGGALEPGVAGRIAAASVATTRRVVRRLGELGWAVVLQAPLSDAQSTPVDHVAAVAELARHALRTDAPFAWSGAVGEGVDPWIAAAGLPASGRRYLDAIAQLQQVAKTGVTAEDPQGEALARRLDDLPRRLVFDMLRDAWLGRTSSWPGSAPSKEAALARVLDLLGEEGKWVKPFRQFTYETQRRMVLIPTWQCELRCSYCWIPKQDGRVMDKATIERAVEMLLSTEQEEVLLQFFGGEALLEAENVRHAMAYATQRAAEVGKRISFLLSSNGWSLDAEAIAWLKHYPVRLELSLDGDEATQNKYRASRWGAAETSYAHSIATHREAILSSGLEQFVIMVVHATNVDAMPANFFHIADLGFRRIQVNYMQGRVWKPHELASFAKGLHTIGQELIRRWGAGEQVEFINMQHKPMAMRLNGEVTVDWDGKIFGGNGFLHETEHKGQFEVGHLNDLTGVDRYWIDATDNAFLLDIAYRPKVVENNVEVGKIMASFIKWMTRQGYGPAGPATAQTAEAQSA